MVQVLDARDPQGTRSLAIERHLATTAKHKNLVFVLNKVDLVPTWVTRRWVAALSREHPTLAFTAGNITKPFGKGSLIALLRQFSKLHADKKAISVGFIGYPNVGKSSIINALKGSKACVVAPIPGQTKVWQYVTLMKRVFLIDCPGTVHTEASVRGTGSGMGLAAALAGGASGSQGAHEAAALNGLAGTPAAASGSPAALGADAELVLKGVVRAEKLDAPEVFVPAILSRVRPEHVRGTYGLEGWTDATDFLTQLCIKQGRLHRGGEPDLSAVAHNVINDWQRGKLPYYTPPPDMPLSGHKKSSAVAAAAAAAAAAAGAGAGAGAGSSVEDAGALPFLVPAQTLKGLAKHELLAEGESEGEAEEELEEELDEEEGEGEEEAELQAEKRPQKRARLDSKAAGAAGAAGAGAPAAPKASAQRRAGAAAEGKRKLDARALAASLMAATRAASSTFGDLEM